MRLADETTLVTAFNNSLITTEQNRENRKALETWDRYMRQNGEADCDSAPEIATHNSKCLQTEVNFENVKSEMKVADEMIKELEKLSIDYPSKVEKYEECAESINEMVRARIDALTLRYLKNPNPHIDEGGDFQVCYMLSLIVSILYLV